MGNTPIEIDVEKFLLWLSVASTDRHDIPILTVSFTIANEYGAKDQCLRTTQLCFQEHKLWQYIPSWDGYHLVGAFGPGNFRRLNRHCQIWLRKRMSNVEEALQRSSRHWYIGRDRPRRLRRRTKYWLENQRVEKRVFAEFLDSLTGDRALEEHVTPPEIARMMLEDWLK